MKNRIKKFYLANSLILLSFYVNSQVVSISGEDVQSQTTFRNNPGTFLGIANNNSNFNWGIDTLAEKTSFLCCPCHYLPDDLRYENDSMYRGCSTDRHSKPLSSHSLNGTISSCCTQESIPTSTSDCTGKIFKIYHLNSTEINFESVNNNRSDCVANDYSDCHCGQCVIGEKDTKREHNFVLVGLLIASITLMIATISIYRVLPMFQNIHGKCISNHLICLMLFFVCQLLEIFVKPADKILTSFDRKLSVCWVLGMVSYLLSMWANFWLAAINLDIYHTFRNQTIEKANASRKRYRKLQIGAWSIPIVIVSVVIFLDFYVEDDSIICPLVGCERCFFAVVEGYSVVIFYYSIIGGLLCFNLFTFIVANHILCTYQCRTSLSKKKNDSTISIITSRMFLFFKLFCVTGTTWTINFGLWFYQYHNLNPEERPLFAVMLEAFNVSHGFCYFIVFICKPDVLKQLWTLGTKPNNRIGAPSEFSSRFATNQSSQE